jgi:hypothetical protein
VAFVSDCFYFQCSELGGRIWQDSVWVPEIGLAVRA